MPVNIAGVTHLQGLVNLDTFDPPVWTKVRHTIAKAMPTPKQAENAAAPATGIPCAVKPLRRLRQFAGDQHVLD